MILIDKLDLSITSAEWTLEQDNANLIGIKLPRS